MPPSADTSAPKLTASVGWGGANWPEEVQSVQQLLNSCIPLLVPMAPLENHGRCDALTLGMIREFQRRVVKMPRPDARVDPGGRTLDALVTCAAGRPYVPKASSAGAPAEPSDGKKYTDSPNEVTTQRTTPAAADVVQMIVTAWPELGQQGARTLTAQFMAETGDGKYCFNWNLGNVKSGPNDSHMYLHNVWECESDDAARANVAKAGGLAQIATEAERAKHGWKCPAATVVYQPPHPQCRFRAYASLTDGAQRWLGHHQRIAQKNPKYLAALTAGDVPAAAHALKQAGYCSAAEASYAHAMTAKKQQLDKQLGPL